MACSCKPKEEIFIPSDSSKEALSPLEARYFPQKKERPHFHKTRVHPAQILPIPLPASKKPDWRRKTAPPLPDSRSSYGRRRPHPHRIGSLPEIHFQKAGAVHRFETYPSDASPEKPCPSSSQPPKAGQIPIEIFSKSSELVS